MAQRIIGLDVGSWSVKAMVMESSLRRMSFVELREHHVPTDALGSPLPGALGPAIKAILEGLDVDVLTAGVPGVQVLMRELMLPFGDEKRVAPVLGFQLESLLPRPLETVVHDWHLLKKGPEGAQILCPAADKQWLEGWLAEVRAGGAEPRHLTLSMLAMDNLVPHLTGLGDKPVAVIDLGHRSTQVTVLKDGKVEAVRALSRGGHQVTQALARALGVAYADAEHIKHHELDLSGDAPRGVDPREHERRVRVAAQALEPILRELKMTLDAIAAQKLRGGHESAALGGIVLCGGMSRLMGLPALLERLLGAPLLPVEPRGPIWETTVARAEALDIGLPAAALALEHMADTDPHRVNLRRGEMALGSDFGALRAKAGWIAAFLAVLLVVFFVRKVMRVSTLEEQEKILAARLDEYAGETLDETPDAELDVRTRFDTMLEMVQSPPGSETSEVYPAMTAFKILYEVTRIQKALNDEAARTATAATAGEDEEEETDEFGLPKPPKAPAAAGGAEGAEAVPVVEKRQVELNSFAADLKSAAAGQATLTGSAFDIVTVESFASQLRQYPCFKKVDRQETRKTSNPNHPNWTDFTIKIEVKCDVSEEAPRAEAGERAKAADKGETKPGEE